LRDGGKSTEEEIAEMEYTVLDESGEASGFLEMVIFNDYAALSKVKRFDWMPGGFRFFEKQLPTSDVYPIAVLEWMETDFKKQKRGIGSDALRAFRIIAQEHGARLGLLRVGTGGPAENNDIESALLWRQKFYERDSWIRFENPPCEGLVVFWMYNLLRPIQSAERPLQNRLVEKPPKDPFLGLPQPIPISETSTPTSEQTPATGRPAS
jgi:hypothetical protein